jgi:hypothetical protein
LGYCGRCSRTILCSSPVAGAARTSARGAKIEFDRHLWQRYTSRAAQDGLDCVSQIISRFGCSLMARL